MKTDIERLKMLVFTHSTEKKLAKAIAANIRARRIELGYTQADLANLTRKKQPHIARLERSSYGRHTVHSLNILAVALDTTVSELTKIRKAENNEA